MKVNGVTFYWGTDFLPRGKEFEPVAMVQETHTNSISASAVRSRLESLNEDLANAAKSMNCNVVILQDRHDSRPGDSSYFNITLTGHAGTLMDKDV